MCYKCVNFQVIYTQRALGLAWVREMMVSARREERRLCVGDRKETEENQKKKKKLKREKGGEKMYGAQYIYIYILKFKV